MGAYDIVIYHGKKLDRFSMQRMQAAEDRLGYELTIVQGSYNSGVSASAGTHDGGGAFDGAPYDWDRKCRILRQEGWAAWHRPTLPGVWGEHIHCILYDNKRLSSGAVSQKYQYYAHTDGLAGHGWDSQWRPDPIPHFKFRRKPKRQKINLTVLITAWDRKGGATYGLGKPIHRKFAKALRAKDFLPHYKYKDAIYGRSMRDAVKRANQYFGITKYTGPNGDRPTWELCRKLGLAPYKVKTEKRPNKKKYLKPVVKTYHLGEK